MGAHHGAMKRLVVGQQGLPAHASAKHEWPQNFFHGLREPREPLQKLLSKSSGTHSEPR